MADGNTPRKLALAAPTIGFLNLLGESGAALLEADRAVLAPPFRGCVTSTEKYPWCDVLFIYCAFDDSGKIVGSKDSVREIAKACSARIVVLAAGNTADLSINTRQPKNDWAVNIVETLKRNDPFFVQFFHNLFNDMFNGTTLAESWVGMAPQGPRAPNEPVEPSSPDAVVVPDIPNLIFGPDWFPGKEIPPASDINPVADAILSLVRDDCINSGNVKSDASVIVGNAVEDLHAPTFFSALGALLGFSVFQSMTWGGYLNDDLKRSYNRFIMPIDGRDGHKYIYGDLVNWLLFEETPGRLTAWRPILEALTASGSAAPDLIAIVKHVSTTVGDPAFGIPGNLPAEFMPKEMPMTTLKRIWPQVAPILQQHHRPARGWPLDLGCVIACALDETAGLSKTIAAQIVMEAAIPMSKLGQNPW